MAKYINSDSIIKGMIKYQFESQNSSITKYGFVDELLCDDVVEVKHGHWLDTSNGWMCSICDSDSKSDTNFCPNCGADMRGKIK